MDGKKVAVSLCILENDDKYLLIHRGKRKQSIEECVNQYIPIGGKFESFETPEDCCIREVKEETGIDINDPILLGIITETSPLPKYNWIDYIFYKKVEKQTLLECDEGELCWIEKNDITNVPTPLIDKKIYEYLVKNKKFIISAIYNEDLQLISAYEYLEGKDIF